MGFRIDRPDTAFSLDAPSKRAGRGDKNPKHLAFIRKLPCAVCGARRTIEAAHVSMPDPERGKTSRAYGQKAPDRWTVPLCRSHHMEQHDQNEANFWTYHRIDAVGLAQRLFEVSGNQEAGEAVIASRSRHRPSKGPSSGETE